MNVEIDSLNNAGSPILGYGSSAQLAEFLHQTGYTVESSAKSMATRIFKGLEKASYFGRVALISRDDARTVEQIAASYDFMDKTEARHAAAQYYRHLTTSHDEAFDTELLRDGGKDLGTLLNLDTTLNLLDTKQIDAMQHEVRGCALGAEHLAGFIADRALRLQNDDYLEHAIAHHL